MKDDNGETILDSCLLLTEGNYYPVPEHLKPMLISLLEANGIERCHCDDDENLVVEGQNEN